MRIDSLGLEDLKKLVLPLEKKKRKKKPPLHREQMTMTGDILPSPAEVVQSATEIEPDDTRPSCRRRRWR